LNRVIGSLAKRAERRSARRTLVRNVLAALAVRVGLVALLAGASVATAATPGSSGYLTDVAGVQDALKKLHERLGAPPKGLELLVYPEFIRIQAQDPRKVLQVQKS
jgi:hypothetical protein